MAFDSLVDITLTSMFWALLSLMKFMNVAQIEFFDILSKLPSSIIFSRNWSPLTVMCCTDNLHCIFIPVLLKGTFQQFSNSLSKPERTSVP